VSKCAVRRAASLAEVASGSPIDRGDSPHYAPTQFLAEYMRAAGYASIRYRSGFGAGGDNIALFNLDDAAVLDVTLKRLRSIHMTFSTWP
jgi:RES domain